jgi:hypothetical protein
MSELTINLPDKTDGDKSKWARVVAQIESLPGLGEYEEAFRRSQQEFRRSFGSSTIIVDELPFRLR